MNLLPSGDRNKEMSELLFRNYKAGIVFSADSVAVDFYENRPIAITIDMLMAGVPCTRRRCRLRSGANGPSIWNP